MEAWEEQDERIQELESSMPPAQMPILGEWVRHDWRPCRALMDVIFLAFKGIRYPSVQQRQAAWERYQELRHEAKNRQNSEWLGLEGQSSWHRDAVLGKCKGITYSPVSDDLVPFDHATSDQVKLWGRYLHEAISFYNEVKHLLLHDDRVRCCEKFDEVSASHDLFFGRQKESRQARTDANLAKNRERLAKAQAAREKVEANIDRNREKLNEGGSPSYMARVQEWIDTDEETLSDIDRSIAEIQSWIDEDERRLSD